MKQVVIYASPLCGYCHAAKKLLATKAVRFEEIDILQEPKRKAEMITRAKGRHTVPQIFIGQTHIGGYDDLNALENAGKLDGLLAG